MTISNQDFNQMWDKLLEPVRELQSRVSDISRQSARAEVAGAVEVVDALPTAGKAGRVLLLSTDHLLYYDNGTTWVAIGASTAKFATGVYTGNGAATKAITGVGFQPKYVRLYPHASATVTGGMKSDQDGLYAFLEFDNLYRDQYLTDMIISLDADGFTVGDGTGLYNHLNQNGLVYNFAAWG